MIVKFLLYTLSWILIYIVANYCYKKSIKKNTSKCPLYLILLVSLISVGLNILMTGGEDTMASDRLNYVQNFENNRETPSLGLLGMMNLVTLAGGDFYMFLNVTTFISMFVTMLAYRYSDIAKPSSLIFIFLSQYVLTTFIALKQCYASALLALMFVLLLKEKSWKNDLICVLLIALAYLFHPTAFLAIPLFVMLRFKFKIFENPKRLIFLLLITTIFLKPILLFVAQVTSFLPFFANKINEYFGPDATLEGESRVMILLKGIPFYYIAFITYKYRNKLVSIIEYYNGYLILTFFTALAYVISLYDPWMTRLMYLLCVPVFIFYSNVLNYIPNSRIHRNFVYISLFVITYRFMFLTKMTF